MKYVATLGLALFLIVTASPYALAHRPYYTQIKKIRLPNGDLGEVRLLHGDGIFFTDPVRPLIVDSNGRLVARGPKAYSMVISCNGDHHCLVADLWNERIYQLEPVTFRQGAVQPAVKPGGRTDDWDLEDGDESWGFTTRDATSSELLAGNLTMAKESLVGLLLIAVAAGLGAFSLVPFRLNIQSRWKRTLARTGFFLAGSIIFLMLAAIAFWFALLGGLSFELWSLSSMAGIGLAWITAWIGNRKPRRTTAG